MPRHQLKDRIRATLAASAVMAVPVSSAHAQWTDIAGTAVRDFLYNTRGLAWGDTDDDGDLDLVMINFDGPGRLLRNDAGVFSLAPSVDLGRHQDDANQPVLADFDNDGDLDLYLANSTLSYLFRNDGRTGNNGVRFTDISTGSPISLPSVLARGAAWGDFDRDGWVDLYVSSNGQGHPEEEDTLFRNVGGQLSDVTPPLMKISTIGRACIWADYDNDGDQDLYVANGFGCPCDPDDPYPDHTEQIRNRMYRNNAGSFEEVTADPLGDIDSARGAAWGDIDRDGDLDLYIANLRLNGVGGLNKLLRNDGPPPGSPGDPPRFVDITTTTLADRGSHRSCAFVDVDNDGDLDIHVVGLSASTPCRLFVNDGAGRFSRVDSGELTLPGPGGAAAWADFDADGDMDVAMTWGGAPGNRLLRNDLNNGHNFLEVKLTGVESNRSAIGARIEVLSALEPNGPVVLQIREVQSGSGYLSQHMLTQHFGLRHGTHAVINIRWPSGIVQRIETSEVNRILHITEQRCNGDFNSDGVRDSQDFFDFLDAFFLGVADFNADGASDSQDFFDFFEDFLASNCGA